MKIFLLLLPILFCFSCQFDINKNDIKQAKTAFSELEKTLNFDSGKLWNYKLNGPILIINRETRNLIANESDNDGLFVKQGNFYVGEFPENMNIANSAIEWLHYLYRILNMKG